MSATINAAAEPQDRVLVITRVFDAPRELVFKMWTENEHMVRWLCPRGFTATRIIANDPRPGGAFRFYMRDPDGGDHWQQGVYRELVPPERLVRTFVWTDADGNPTRPETLLTVTFEEVGGKTRLTLHQAVFESVTARDLHGDGWGQSLDRLAEHLATA
jgi:uncharacterized protein YndB with AHSA1/START domain